ncbi:MAG: twin-arginine translocase TatA/TatE family subunit [Gemmatimonadaceae bacterium]
MEGFGVDKLLLILVIVLVLFGARRVPEIGASIGKGIREFKRGMKDIGDGDQAPIARVELPRTVSDDSAAEPPPEPKRLLGS